MVEPGPIAANAARKGRQKLADPLAEIDRQAKDCAELDHDRKHLPVAVREVDAEKRFRDAQMRSGTDRKKFGDSFDNAQQE